MRYLYLSISIFSINYFLLNLVAADKTIKNLKKAYKDSFPVAELMGIHHFNKFSTVLAENGSPAFCENRVSAFTVSDNTRLVSSSSLVYEDVTEEVCLKMCSDNRDNRGRTILCASFVYDHATFVCTVYRSKSYPEDNLEREVAPGKRFFEKFCLAEDVPADCADSQFQRADQSVIIGYAKNVSIATSIEECIAQCLTEHFQCKSAMYFYKESECITNTESAMTQPTSFAREDSDKVIYIQNGCPAVLAQQKQLESSATPAPESESELTTTDDDTRDVTDETELTSSTAPTVGDADDTVDNEETTATATTTTNLPIEENTLKGGNESGEGVDDSNFEEQSSSLFQTDPTEPATFEETTAASTIEKISKVLTRKLKKLRTGSYNIDFDKHPKSLKQTKLQQAKKELAFEESSEKNLEESAPLEVEPSEFQAEIEHADRPNPAAAVHEKAKARGLSQKPIKRLKIETLSRSEEDDHFSQWSNWSPCKKPGERRIRRRKCYNLRKCVGALMEVGECSKTVQDVEPGDRAPDDDESRIGKGPFPPPGMPFQANDKADLESGAPPGILPGPQQSEPENEPTKKVNEEIWSPWPGICQEFASGQPCKNHEIIGFESRDCLAADQTKCKGPFFRYCTISCE